MRNTEENTEQTPPQPEPDFDPAILEHALIDRVFETWPAACWDFLSRTKH